MTVRINERATKLGIVNEEQKTAFTFEKKTKIQINMEKTFSFFGSYGIFCLFVDLKLINLHYADSAAYQQHASASACWNSWTAAAAAELSACGHIMSTDVHS